MNEQPQSTGLKQPDVMGIAPAPEVPVENATSSATPEVDFLGGLDEKSSGYLKGLGISEITPETVAKLVQAGLHQKESTSRISREKAELEAKVASYVAPEPEPSIQPQSDSVATPAQENKPVQPQANTPSKNEIFQLSRMIFTEFPELQEAAKSDELFNDLKKEGLFSSEGIDMAGAYAYLEKKNAQAKEIRELREFRAQYEQAQEQESQYNPNGHVSSGVKDAAWAREVLMQNISNPSSVDARDLQEATALIQSSLM